MKASAESTAANGSLLIPYDVLDALHAYARAGLLAHGVGAVILAVAYFRHAPLWACLVWLLALLLVCLARWQAWRRYRLREPGCLPQEQGARCCWDFANLMGGAVWGLAIVLFYPSSDVPLQIGLTVLVCALCIVLPASRYPVYLATLVLGFAPILAHVALDGMPHGNALSAVLILVFLSAAWAAYFYRHAFAQLFVLKSRVEALAVQLAEEKVRAEQATLSKTRFFAAASHDLRQPLQALLLFADALGHKELSPSASELVNELGASVRSLEGMFDALLDLGQLEAGAVQVRMRPVPLDMVYKALLPHLRPLAFDRGLALVFRGGERWVHVDPVLLERVLRNLLTNALRCTEDGGVLLSCRPRGPAHWALQVWDTGCGIEPAALSRVFDEFYRAGRPALGRDKGLGLGLAIAQGLAGLMGSCLTVRSTPGRGTVFTLLLQRAEPASSLSPGEPAPPQRASDLAERCIVLLAADTPERRLIEAPLRSWRADLQVCDDLAAFRLWCAQHISRSGDAPELLLLGPDQAAAQAGLLAAWTQAWPGTPRRALLLGDDTLLADPGWTASLHLPGPVAPHRLRSSIASLLRLPGPSLGGGTGA